MKGAHIRHVDVFIEIHDVLALWMDLDQDLVLSHDLQYKGHLACLSGRHAEWNLGRKNIRKL